MYACQQGYPCIWSNQLTDSLCVCSLPACVMSQEYGVVVDTLSHSANEFVRRKSPKTREWIVERHVAEFTEREFARMVTEANTYDRRHSVVRQKRCVTV